jgi:hypothetical protein
MSHATSKFYQFFLLLSVFFYRTCYSRHRLWKFFFRRLFYRCLEWDTNQIFCFLIVANHTIKSLFASRVNTLKCDLRLKLFFCLVNRSCTPTQVYTINSVQRFRSIFKAYANISSRTRQTGSRVFWWSDKLQVFDGEKFSFSIRLGNGNDDKTVDNKSVIKRKTSSSRLELIKSQEWMIYDREMKNPCDSLLCRCSQPLWHEGIKKKIWKRGLRWFEREIREDLRDLREKSLKINSIPLTTEKRLRNTAF